MNNELIRTLEAVLQAIKVLGEAQKDISSNTLDMVNKIQEALLLHQKILAALDKRIVKLERGFE